MRKAGIGIIIWGVLLFGSHYGMGQETGGNKDYQYALIEAVKQKNLGNLPEAVKLYRLVIKDQPDCQVAYFELGNIYLMSKQVDLAKDNLKMAYSLDPNNQWYTISYLNALGASEDYETIADILREKRKSNPEDVEWDFQLASVYFTQGKAKKSIRILDKIENDKGFSEKITLLKASIYESEQKYELAKTEIEKVMLLFPEAIQFRIVAAELCMKSGDEDMAAGYYQEILEIDSANIFALTNLTDYFRKKEDFQNSLRYLTKSFNNPQIDVKRKLAILSYYLSEDKFVSGYPDELDRLIMVFLTVHPNQHEGRLIAADFYIETRAYERAYGQVKTYLESNNGNYPLYMQAIMLANAASLNEELIQMTDRALVLFPDSADIRFFRGLGFYEEGEYVLLIENFQDMSFEDFTVKEYTSQSKMLYAEAFYRMENYARSDSLFEKLIADEPNNYMVLNNYSFYLAEREAKLTQALSWSWTTITNNPENATFLDTYAWVLFKMEEFEDAEKYILNALDKGGENDPEVNEHAGDIQAALKSYELAISYYLKAIIVGGERERLELKIESLKNSKNE